MERLPSVHLCPVTLPLTPFRSCLDSAPQTWTPLQAHGRELWSFYHHPLSVSRLTIWEWCSWSMAGAPVSQLNGVSPSTVWAVVLRSVTMTVSVHPVIHRQMFTQDLDSQPPGLSPWGGVREREKARASGPWCVGCVSGGYLERGRYARVGICVSVSLGLYVSPLPGRSSPATFSPQVCKKRKEPRYWSPSALCSF